MNIVLINFDADHSSDMIISLSSIIILQGDYVKYMRSKHILFFFEIKNKVPIPYLHLFLELWRLKVQKEYNILNQLIANIKFLLHTDTDHLDKIVGKLKMAQYPDNNKFKLF
jgi:hypothetical protein